MLNITETIKKIFHKTINKIYSKSSHEKQVTQDVRRREFELYSEERVNQQHLYEKWVVKDSWCLMSEALPLLTGFNPEDKFLMITSGSYGNKIDDLWKHAKQCVEQGLLPVMNRESKPEDWKIHPFNAYRWAAVSRVEIPEELVNLMEFVMKTVMQPVAQGDSTVKSDNTGDYGREYDEDRERVLGIALAILAAYSERCRNNGGRVQTDKILEIINEKGEFWFGDYHPTLSKDAMRDLIDKWINTVP